METYGHEYFEAVTNAQPSTTSTGPLILGGGGGEGSARGPSGSSWRDDDDEGVVWQGSQTCPALSRLMKSGTRGRRDVNRYSFGVESDLPNAPSAPPCAPFSFDAGNESYASDASSSSTTTRARALAPSARRNVSSSATSSSTPSSSSHPAFEFFPQIVKRATSQVDENLKQKSSLSRTSSANRLNLSTGRVHASSNPTVPKPRRHSPMHGTRPKDRVVSEGAMPFSGSGREHRVGGDVKGKGRLRDERTHSGKDASTSISDEGMLEDGEAAGSKQMKPRGIEREAKMRRDMPPPALPPERVLVAQPAPAPRPPAVKSTAVEAQKQVPPPNPTAIAQPPVQHAFPRSSQLQPRPPQSSREIASANAQRRASEARRPLPHAAPHSAPSTTVSHPHRGNQAALPPAPVSSGTTMSLAGAISASYAPASSKTTHPPPRPSQAMPLVSQPPALPLPSQAPRPSQASHQPPLLGMRRANTFSSSGSQKSYPPFEFSTQKPSRSSSSGGLMPQGQKSTQGGAVGQGHKPAYAAPMELPKKQKPFRPPFKQRTKSTLELFDGYDFQTGELVKTASSTSKGAANGPSSASGSAGKQTAGSMTSAPAVKSTFAPASRASSFNSRSMSRDLSHTPYPEGSLSGSTTSSTSSLTLSSGGRTPPLITDETSPPEKSRTGGARSPVTPVAHATMVGLALAAKGSGVPAVLKGPARNGDDEVQLLSDRSDESFGDFGWDEGELAEAGRMFD